MIAAISRMIKFGIKKVLKRLNKVYDINIAALLFVPDKGVKGGYIPTIARQRPSCAVFNVQGQCRQSLVYCHEQALISKEC